MEQNGSDIPPKISPTFFSSRFILVVVGFMLLLIVGIGAYYLGKKQTNEVTLTNLTPTTSATISLSPTTQISPDETKDWKTYTNSQFKYELRYPLNFSVQDEGEVQATLSRVNITSSDNKSTVSIEVYGKPPKMTVENLAEEFKRGGPGFGRVGLTGATETISTVFAGQDAKMYSSESGNHYFISNGTYIFHVMTSPKSQTKNQILSTFKFLNATETPKQVGSETYTSSNLGISFDYLEKQNNWTIEVKESGNKICLTYDPVDTACSKGSYVEVIEKSSTESFMQATSRLSQQDSFSHNKKSYFIMQKDHPEKILYISLGEYDMLADNVQTWDKTIKIVK